jgi:DNA-binding XRE family transcriptional regulator
MGTVPNFLFRSESYLRSGYGRHLLGPLPAQNPSRNPRSRRRAVAACAPASPTSSKRLPGSASPERISNTRSRSVAHSGLVESKGWKVGNADEFLDLSPEQSAYIEMKLELADSLRKRRQRRKLTQDQLARMVKSSQSRVAKMEAGDPSVSIGLLVRSLLAPGASKRDVAKIIAP